MMERILGPLPSHMIKKSRSVLNNSVITQLLDLFTVVLSSNRWLRLQNSQLVRLLCYILIHLNYFFRVKLFIIGNVLTCLAIKVNTVRSIKRRGASLIFAVFLVVGAALISTTVKTLREI